VTTIEAPASTGPRHRRRRQHRGWIQWVLLALPVVVILVGGWAHRWASDDSYIDFRIVHNVLTGHGPVFNVGERVEVDTNPLWVLILVVVSGIGRFLAIAWWAVLLGLAMTAAGVGLAVAGGIRLNARHSAGLVFPAGLLVAVSIDAFWDFSTSGLETGLIFGWLGLSFWLLARQRTTGRGGSLVAVLASLGPFIRPDMLLFSLAMITTALIVAAGQGRWRKVRLVAWFLGPILVGELARMAYYGMLVPNTALTKSAFSPRIHQGLVYAKDMVKPTWVWVPMLLLVPVLLWRLLHWWRAEGGRVDVAIVGLLATAGLLDAAYVVFIGGDFMHARMFLPALFALGTITWLDLSDKFERTAPLVVAVAFSVVSCAVIRYPQAHIGKNLIANERRVYIYLSQNPHPISPSDYSHAAWARYGMLLAKTANEIPRGTTMMVVLSSKAELPDAQFPAKFVAARSPLPSSLIVPAGNIGVMGWFAGDKVYLFDRESLANPIGGHLTKLPDRGRPGHNDPSQLFWMIARFGLPGEEDVLGGHLGPTVLAARRQLACPLPAAYLRAITTPLTFGQALTNIVHAPSWTSFEIERFPRATTPCPG
jgi:arabinofuranosyltransferase